LWTIFKRSSIVQLRRYTLTVDGQTRQIRASEVLVSNTALLEAPTHLFGSPETINDGQLDVYMITAQTLGNYLHVAWNLLRHPGQSTRELNHWGVQHSIRIDSNRHPQLVQGDGEVIGHTPVEVQLVPKAIHVIMPTPKTLEEHSQPPLYQQLLSSHPANNNGELLRHKVQKVSHVRLIQTDDGSDSALQIESTNGQTATIELSTSVTKG
jgi:hypothetical protein